MDKFDSAAGMAKPPVTEKCHRMLSYVNRCFIKPEGRFPFPAFLPVYSVRFWD